MPVSTSGTPGEVEMPPRASPMLGSPSSSTMDRRRARAASTGGGVMRSIPLRTQESEIAVERNGMPRAPTLPAMRAVTRADAMRLMRAPKMRSGPLRAVAATLPRMARPIAAPAACPPTSRATAIGDADDGAPERLRDDAGDERDREERDDAAGDDAGDRADAARESVAPALAEVHQEQQDEQHVEQSRGEHGGIGLRANRMVPAQTPAIRRSRCRCSAGLTASDRAVTNAARAASRSPARASSSPRDA